MAGESGGFFPVIREAEDGLINKMVSFLEKKGKRSLCGVCRFFRFGTLVDFSF